MEFTEPVEEKCVLCNTIIIQADYSDDPNLYYCPNPACNEEYA